LAKATIEDVQAYLRDLFAQLRIGGGYAEAMRVVRAVFARLTPRAGKIRKSLLPRLVNRAATRAEPRVELSPDVTKVIVDQIDAFIDAAPDRRVVILEWWATLPTPDRTLIESYYLRPAAEPIADMAAFTRLHLELLHRVDREAPVKDSKPAETDETDLARLTLQRAVGDFDGERRAVLEALLTGERGNQQFFVRLTHAVAELEWRLGPQPDWAEFQPPPPIPLREQLVTWAFMAGCCLAVASVIYAIFK
jgi:hypothetical protein